MNNWLISGLILALLIAPITNAQLTANEITDKTNCDFNYCCSDLTITNYNATTLSKFEASKTTDMIIKIGNINFVNITKLKTGQIRVCGYIRELHNYWGIKGLWESTWWNNSFNYRVNISSNQAPNRNETISFYMSQISGWAKAQMQSDCDDIRIVNSSDTGQIDYFVDICNTTDVRVGFLNTYNASGVIAKAYWGYASAEAQNKSMRIFYDDFNDGSIDSNWKLRGGSCNPQPTIVEQNGVLNQTTDAGTECREFWEGNTSALQYETVIAKVWWSGTGNILYTGLCLGGKNATSNMCRTINRMYNSDTQIEFGEDDVANGPAITPANAIKNSQWNWFMANTNATGTSMWAWNITVNQPSAKDGSYATGSRAGYFGLVWSDAYPPFVQYDEFQIWDVGYRPTFYATSSTITLSSSEENCALNITLYSNESLGCVNYTHSEWNLTWSDSCDPPNFSYNTTFYEDESCACVPNYYLALNETLGCYNSTHEAFNETWIDDNACDEEYPLEYYNTTYYLNESCYVPINATGGYNYCSDNITLVKNTQSYNGTDFSNHTYLYYCEYGCDDLFNRCRDNPLLELVIIIGIIMLVITIIVLFFKRVLR